MWPITPESYQKAIDDVVEVKRQKRGPVPQGLTVRLAPVRDTFLAAAFQQDVGFQFSEVGTWSEAARHARPFTAKPNLYVNL